MSVCDGVTVGVGVLVGVGVAVGAVVWSPAICEWEVACWRYPNMAERPITARMILLFSFITVRERDYSISKNCLLAVRLGRSEEKHPACGGR